MDTLDRFQANYFDYDLFGEIIEGNIKIDYERDALVNSLKLWISSKRGDFVGGKTLGGYVRSAISRPMTETDALDVYQSVKNGLKDDFRPVLEILDLEITPDYEKKRWNIRLDAFAPEMRERILISESLKEGS